MASLVTGQEFRGALRIPAMRLVKLCIDGVRALAPQLTVSISPEYASFLAPLITTAGRVSVGAVAPLHPGLVVEEDTTLLGTRPTTYPG